MIEENPSQIRIMVNYIAKKFENIRICNIEYNIENCFSVLKTTEIDIIIIDLENNQNTEIDLIKYIERNKLYRYKKSIIVKVNQFGHKEISKANQYVLSYINKISEIEHVLHVFIAKKRDMKYLEETILEIYKMNIKFEGNLEKEIYPIIAKRHQKKMDTIYGNIKFATNHMIMDCKEEKLNQYLGHGYFEKPKVKEIIFKVLSKIL
jgi:response regulator receiver domain